MPDDSLSSIHQKHKAACPGSEGNKVLLDSLSFKAQGQASMSKSTMKHYQSTTSLLQTLSSTSNQDDTWTVLDSRLSFSDWSKSRPFSDLGTDDATSVIESAWENNISQSALQRHRDTGVDEARNDVLVGVGSWVEELSDDATKDIMWDELASVKE